MESLYGFCIFLFSRPEKKSSYRLNAFYWRRYKTNDEDNWKHSWSIRHRIYSMVNEYSLQKDAFYHSNIKYHAKLGLNKAGRRHWRVYDWIHAVQTWVIRVTYLKLGKCHSVFNWLKINTLKCHEYKKFSFHRDTFAGFRHSFHLERNVAFLGTEQSLFNYLDECLQAHFTS